MFHHQGFLPPRVHMRLLLMWNVFVFSPGAWARAGPGSSAIIADSVSDNGAVREVIINKISPVTGSAGSHQFTISDDEYVSPSAGMSSFVRDKMKSWGVTPEMYNNLQDRYLRGGGKREYAAPPSRINDRGESKHDFVDDSDEDSDQHRNNAQLLPVDTRPSSFRSVNGAALRQAAEEKPPIGQQRRGDDKEGPEFWDVVAWIGTQIGKAVRLVFNGFVKLAKAIYVGVAYGWNEAGPGGSSSELSHK